MQAAKYAFFPRSALKFYFLNLFPLITALFVRIGRNSFSDKMTDTECLKMERSALNVIEGCIVDGHTLSRKVHFYSLHWICLSNRSKTFACRSMIFSFQSSTVHEGCRNNGERHSVTARPVESESHGENIAFLRVRTTHQDLNKIARLREQYGKCDLSES